MTRLLFGTVVLALCAFVPAHSGTQVAAAGAELPALCKLPAVDPAKETDPVRKIIAQMCESADRELAQRVESHRMGQGQPNGLYAAIDRVVRARLEWSAGKDDLPVLQAHVETTKAIYDLNKVRFEQGIIRAADMEHARYQYLNAELMFARYKPKPDSK
ncbi:MAG: hypothetical protein K1X57_11780 [Gemmataceae bacterium]|nr:hypothetical protein [Gemmataceae bacterium]